MVHVKICGITNLEDALTCVEAGAEALGFNFYAPSPRYIDPEAARKIVDQLPADVLTVGVFVNGETPEIVEHVATAAGVAALQLHGDESPDYCRALSARFVIKVLPVSREFKPERALAYQVQAIMLDALDRAARGGTGRVIDWSVAVSRQRTLPRLSQRLNLTVWMPVARWKLGLAKRTRSAFERFWKLRALRLNVDEPYYLRVILLGLPIVAL